MRKLFTGVVDNIDFNPKLFTVGVVDNIDFNPNSISDSNSFHSTDISLNQHREVESDGQEQSVLLFDSKQECLGIPHLPETQRNFLPAVAPPKEHLMVPGSHGPRKPEIA
ncbi:hypothetical protein PoB_000896400 [Plakobranchus ocellatus]|uniref:Uncharacterized protein n=1 Tax=Plakobranchus ocellatus TaxID=259542 RepID=A0AAV3YJK0_9GAST|nr:hypothetical protein PoB_000896400 [Plakobranchus ocellatus]